MTAEFCEDCPLRGRCKGPLIGIKTSPYEGKRFGTGAFIGTFAAVIDAKNRNSEPLEVSRSIGADEIIEEISECEFPTYKEKGIFRKRLIPQCRALGRYVITDPQLGIIARKIF
jgi:hypothetical protein